MTSIAPRTAPATTAAPEPRGWTPDKLTAVPSTRPAGMLPSAFDAYRGRTELGNGQPLSGVQVAAFAPFLASSFQLPEPVVRKDLEAVRLYTGGPAAHMPNTAVTIARDIYVHDEQRLRNIMSWGYRRWLAHELGHVLQWRQVPDRHAGTDAARTRRSIERYIGGMVADHEGRPGAVPRGVVWWLHDRLNNRQPGRKPIALGDAIHDTHHLEIQAEDHARAFEQRA